MNTRAEQLLYLLLWSAERLIRPTFRNLDESFEGWAYRSGLLRRVRELERQRFLERRGTTDRIYRLTEKGLVRALGGRDPQACWSRPWDGWWRLVCFDVPNSQNQQRRRLRYYLRQEHFGILQASIWITPDPLDKQERLLRRTKTDVGSLILFRARACAGESDADIVAGAWNFDHINQLYRHHLNILKALPSRKIRDQTQATAMLRWAEAERAAWNRAIFVDPFLPKPLLPEGYLGQRAWTQRVQVIKRAARLSDYFTGEQQSG